MCYYALSFPTHVRSSRRRWRWVSAVLDLLHPRLAGSSTMALPLRPDVRFTACTIECPRTGVVRSGMVRVASDSRRMWPKMESRLRQIRLAKPSSPVCLVQGVRSMDCWLVCSKFNASKCLSANKSQHRLHYVYQFMWSGFRYCTSGEIPWRLTFPWHVATKAHQKLGFLRRNLKGSPLDCKKLAYVALVHSALEYASWDPYLQKDVDSLERVQQKATRLVTST